MVKTIKWSFSSSTSHLVLMFIYRRKQVGVLASEHWNTCTGKFPKFNTPDKKAELQQFAKKISDECSLPEAGFSTDGIAQHIKSFFSEQRRFHKNKQKVSELLLKLLYLAEELIMWLVDLHDQLSLILNLR